MLIVGLTGGIGSGKSTVANLFAERGIHVVDADVVARECVAPGSKALEAIVARFGEGFLQADSSLHRQKLREYVFEREDDRLWLESLLHEQIRKRMQLALTLAPSAYAVAVIPLLAENYPVEYLDRICVVDVSEETQLKRACERDSADPQLIEAIIAAQANREERLAIADDVIFNDGELSQLEQQVEKMHQYYLSLND